MTTAVWTDAFHGVSHLKPVKQGFQVTITDYGVFVYAFVASHDRFTPMYSDYFPTIASAKTWSETVSKRIGLVE